MDREVRRKLAMLERVREFVRTQPSEGVSWTGVVSRLEELLARAGEYAAAEEAGRRGARGATARRRTARDRMHQEMVSHLVTTAQVAFKGNDELLKAFVLPRRSGPYKSYGIQARALHDRALPLREELVAAGLGDTLLDELGTALEEFDAATAAVVVRRREHVDARLRLIGLTDLMMEQVRLLDGLMRPRFRDDPELGALWQSLRSVDGPERAGRNGVVGEIGPAPGNEMVVPSGPTDEPSTEQVQEQGLLPSGGTAQQDNPPDGEGERDAG